jgi:hypothetical protein
MVGYNITIQLINHVDALTVWDLRPHAPPLTMSVVLTGNKKKVSGETSFGISDGNTFYFITPF